MRHSYQGNEARVVIFDSTSGVFTMTEKWEKRLKIASGAFIVTLSLWLVGKDVVHLVFR